MSRLGKTLYVSNNNNKHNNNANDNNNIVTVQLRME